MKRCRGGGGEGGTSVRRLSSDSVEAKTEEKDKEEEEEEATRRSVNFSFEKVKEKLTGDRRRLDYSGRSEKGGHVRRGGNRGVEIAGCGFRGI